jgi:arylsulfatase A-like enzyme
MKPQPNVVFIFSDQHRAQAAGYAGDPNAQTPVMDRLAASSLNFTTAVSAAPVCCPYRACLLTGQYPLTHGVFVNDVNLAHRSVTLADAFAGAGYATAYIGKWHLDGHGRSSFIPPERHLGFDFWRVLECSHNYNESYYYADGDPAVQLWPGYDAEGQTRAAQAYIREHSTRALEKPFLLVLSWGPPHNPYQTAPQQFKDRYHPRGIALRPNVPETHAGTAREQLAGYYAHISALDQYLGEIQQTIVEAGISEDTIFVYTSDHGDMLWSQGEQRKQRPWDESILVPFLLSYPALFGNAGQNIPIPFNSPDIMPTLLGLCGIAVPPSVEGHNYAPYLRGETGAYNEGALIECIHTFGEWVPQTSASAREYRGLRTQRYTYVRDRGGPWLLYDNQQDPFQLHNRCGDAQYANEQARLDGLLLHMLAERVDAFLAGVDYMKQWGYPADESGTVPFTDLLYDQSRYFREQK